jgi:uncharacterized protein (DUF488 family)
MDIYTIGHSTHNEEEFNSILKAYKIETLIDIRSYPGSKYVPWFNKENMEVWIPENGIKYLHMPKLGGRRGKIKEVDEELINAWRQVAFKKYAAYTLTKEYEEGINELIEIASKARVCYMCAESLPWRCHRLLVSNTLVSKGLNVFHIMSQSKTIKHELNLYGARAIEKDGKIIYPKDQ